MSQNIALSGLTAAQIDLNTTSNNIANANTYGFKQSRAEFADVYSNSVFSNSKISPGGGVQTTKTAQQFNEGSSFYSSNPMDLRIEGTGFFAIAKDRNLPNVNELTRNGAFHLDKDNFITNSNEEFLLGYSVDPQTGQVSSYEPQPLKIPIEYGKPKPTYQVEYSVNVPANVPAKNVASFDFNDPETYNQATSSTIYDSLGSPYKLTTYYVKDQTQNNAWHTYYTITDKIGEKPLNIVNGDAVHGATGHVGHTMNFNNDGTLASINSGNPITSVALGDPGTNPFAASLNGADIQQTLNFDLPNITQFAAPFEMSMFKENGATPGFLTKVDFDKSGSVLGTYSNGENITLGRIALVRVANEQGLEKRGGTKWDSTSLSGQKVWGESSRGPFGMISSGLLELSNIDMTQELVDLISAQRNFQANSRALDVNNQLQQNILQIR